MCVFAYRMFLKSVWFHHNNISLPFGRFTLFALMKHDNWEFSEHDTKMDIVSVFLNET
jgi:hypothetical protein